MYSVVLVSAVQHSESVLHFFYPLVLSFLSHIGQSTTEY